jgi:hypothetical protein
VDLRAVQLLRRRVAATPVVAVAAAGTARHPRGVVTEQELQAAVVEAVAALRRLLPVPFCRRTAASRQR